MESLSCRILVLGLVDGASKNLHGEDLKFMCNLIESFFGETETMQFEYEKAMDNWEPEFEEDEEETDEE